MFRLRLATLAAAAGLGLVSGCASMSNGSCSSGNGNGGFLSRLCGRVRNRNTTTTVVEAPPVCGDACCGGACGVIGEGPLLVDRGPIVVPNGTPLPSMPLAPGSSIPLAPAPRLVPQPQSQPTPYNP